MTNLDQFMNDNVWIGDFPPKEMTQRPVVVQPFVYPPNHAFEDIDDVNRWWCRDTTIINPSSTISWRVVHHVDRVSAQLDVPGCKLEGIKLELSNGRLSVQAQRTGSTGRVSHVTHIGFDYDPSTAEAVLEDGVLTVTVMKHREKVSHRIVVTKR